MPAVVTIELQDTSSPHARPVDQIEVTVSAPWSSVCFLRGKTGFASANRLCNLSDHLAALFHPLNATSCLGVAGEGEQ